MAIEERLKKISTFVFDVDGVFTDSTLLISKDDVMRTFNIKDGYAVQMAKKNGFNLAVISGGKQDSIVSRMSSIGIDEVFIKIGTAQKPSCFKDYLDSHRLQPEEVLYMGDDIPDLLLMKAFSVFSCCPADAVPEVLAQADYVSHAVGGRGAVREVVELVMKAQDKWLKTF